MMHGHSHFPSPHPHNNHSMLVRLATSVAVLVALGMVAMKTYAYFMTSSVSILSSLIDSIIDCASSLINLVAVYLAFTPADKEHRFGHGKAEALAALGQAIFITFSGTMLLYNAIQNLAHPEPIQETNVGLWIMIVASVLTLALVKFQRYVHSTTQSLAIASDSLHYQGDLMMNLGVIFTILLSTWFQAFWIDPLFALGTAIYIIYGAWHVGQSAFDVLMDRELPEEQRMCIRDIALNHPQVLGIHDLRTRSGGHHQFAQLHLELDGSIPLHQSHQIAHEVEYAIIAKFPNMEVIIHQDPREVDR